MTPRVKVLTRTYLKYKTVQHLTLEGHQQHLERPHFGFGKAKLLRIMADAFEHSTAE